MNLTGLTNIHTAERDIAAPAASPQKEQYRKIQRSPNEEFQARVDRHGRPETIPQSFVALILQKQKRVTVTRNGISFEHQKTRYVYWHENSMTCANEVGEKVLVTFDRDDMSFVHVLTEQGGYVESIPQKGKVAWFDDEAMKDALTKKSRSLNRDMARFQAVHSDTIQKKADRIVSNAEKMQIVNTFPNPEGNGPLDPGVKTERRTATRSGSTTGRVTVASDQSSRFTKADDIKLAVEAIGGQREVARTFKDKTQDRLKREHGDFEQLLGRDADEEMRREEKEYEDSEAAADALDILY